MSKPQSPSTAMQSSKPPSLQETDADPSLMLAWIEARIATIYSTVGVGQQGYKPSLLDRNDYLHIYSAIHNYCTATKRARKDKLQTVPNCEDLYRGLEREIRNYCHDIRLKISAPRNDMDSNAIRQLLVAYIAQWDNFIHLAGLITHLMQPLERDWILRQIHENEKNVYLVQDLHMIIWKEEILEINVDTSITKTVLQEIVNAVTILQRRSEGEAKNDKEIAETTRKSLLACGLNPSFE